MNTETLLLMLAFIFSQNKQLMEDVRPVLDFLEEHKGAVSVLEQMINMKNTAANAPSPEVKTENNAQFTPQAEEKTQSPLQGIANESILKSIRSYLDSQTR